MSLEGHHKFILDAMDRQNAIARKFVAELEAENARLKADVNELADGLKLASEVGIKIADEVTRLKAEVERLTKAGDAMAKTIGENGVHDNGSFLDVAESIDAWHAAKKGGQP